jgi:hypothetical protein
MSARFSLGLFASLIVLMLVSATAASAVEKEVAAPVAAGTAIAQPPAGSASTAPPGAVVVKRPASPLMLDLMAVMDAEEKQIGVLQAKLAQATDAVSAIAVQREIEKVKFDTEVALLRVQATHARRAGRTALAVRIDAAIEEMLRPVARGVPIERPAPTPTTATTNR